MIKRDVIIYAVNHRIIKKTHKYVIGFTSTVEEEIYIGTNSGNNSWWEAIDKEMMNVGIAFKIFANWEKSPSGWNNVSGKLFFDMKMELTRKVRWLLYGHNTPYPIW